MSPLIKICGLSTEETIDAAVEAGAARVGLVFFSKSPRHLELERAAALARHAGDRAVVVALTVDADDASLDEIVATVRPAMLQLHGSETPTRVSHVRARFGLPVMKAIGIAAKADLGAARRYGEVADEILFDAKPPNGATLPGGNGVAFDWRILSALDLAVPFMLSGGLDPENVGRALALTRAQAVDVSSGVEVAPGVKSPERIRAFVKASRQRV